MRPRTFDRMRRIATTVLICISGTLAVAGCVPDHQHVMDSGGRFTGGSWNDLFPHSSRLVYFDARSGMDDPRFAEVLPALKRIEPLELGLLTEGITDASIPRIGEPGSLEILDVRYSRITGEGVSQLGSLTHLKSVWVDRQHWTRADAAVIERKLPAIQVEFMP